MLFACGSDESEEARLGRETRCEGGILLDELEVRLEDAEELDFCVWDGMGDRQSGPKKDVKESVGGP